MASTTRSRNSRLPRAVRERGPPTRRRGQEMLYPDTVEAEVLVHKPWFIATMFAVVLAVFLALNPTGGTMGELMRVVIGDPLQSGLYGRFAIAFVIAVMFSLN